GHCCTSCSLDGAGCCHAKPIQVFKVTFSLVLMKTACLLLLSCCSDSSACGLEAQRIEEMEKMLKEAQQEKARLIENREREVQARRQMLEEERRRREEAERRLQDESAHRRRLVEEEVKMREKQFSQVSGAAGREEE
ncbi:hypothetical protein GOODEAATRI_033108, partial [Goodea atripinnis]